MISRSAIPAACLSALIVALLLVPAADAGSRACNGRMIRHYAHSDASFGAIRVTHMTCAKAKRTIRSWPAGLHSTPGWTCVRVRAIGDGKGYRCRRGRPSFRFDMSAQGP